MIVAVAEAGNAQIPMRWTQMFLCDLCDDFVDLSFRGSWLIPVAFLINFCTNSHCRTAWTAISFIKNRQNQRLLINNLDLSSYSIYPISAKFSPNSYVNVHYLLDCKVVPPPHALYVSSTRHTIHHPRHIRHTPPTQ